MDLWLISDSWGKVFTSGMIENKILSNLFFKQHQQPTWKLNFESLDKKTAGGQVGIVKICKKFLTSIVKEKAG